MDKYRQLLTRFLNARFRIRDREFTGQGLAIVTVVVVVVGIIVGIRIADAIPNPPVGSGGKIAFVCSIGNICVVDADGSDTLEITSFTVFGPIIRNITWLPDGRRIAFEGINEGIFVIDSDGSNLIQIANDESVKFPTTISLSPDGSRIVVAARGDSYSDIYGEGARETRDCDRAARHAAAVDVFIPCHESELYILESDGSGVVQLTNNRWDELSPVWSPDGNRIAFTSDRDGDSEIYSMDADGTNLRQLTHNSWRDYRPVWSPNGANIAFVSNRDGGRNLYVLSPDGTTVRVTNESVSGDFFDAQWSPDSRQIAFISDHEGSNEIYLIDLSDTANPVRLTNNDDKHILQMQWSPDGQRIAFREHETFGCPQNYDGDTPCRRTRLYVMDADGSNVKRLTNKRWDSVRDFSWATPTE